MSAFAPTRVFPMFQAHTPQINVIVSVWATYEIVM